MNKNNKNTYIVLSVIIVILALATFFLMQKLRAQSVENNGTTDIGTGSNVGTFSGTISAVDTGCFVDAVCSVTVDGKKIILVRGGLSLQPDAVVGRLIGVDSIGELKEKIGAFANVYAGLTPDGDYTLYGSGSYYVEITMISDK